PSDRSKDYASRPTRFAATRDFERNAEASVAPLEDSHRDSTCDRLGEPTFDLFPPRVSDMSLTQLMTTLFLLSIAAGACSAAEPVAGLRVLPGFEVTEFAGDDLAHDVFTMTLDPRGRVVVAGRGYIRLLIDDDGDGRADRAVQIADHPKDGAMGLLWEGDTLYAVGDGGLRRVQTPPSAQTGP